MAELNPDFSIPDRPAFKAAEVCEIAKLQPYVLRSWESEFPDLGIARTPGGPRVYRKADVERVLQIRQLVFHDGLTLAGARRKLEGQPVTTQRELSNDDALLFDDVLSADAKARLQRIKSGLKNLLDLVSRDVHGEMNDFHLEAPSPLAVGAGASASASTATVAKRATPRRKTEKN
jgi:DNA-binding transcriptional MerR regulator